MSQHVSVLDLTVLAVYVAAVLALGLWFTTRERTTRDYFRASGRVPWWAAGVSLLATAMSAITFIGVPAKVMATNWAYFLGLLGAVAFVPFARYLVLPFYRRLDITTAYEYLEKRFARPIRLLGSGLFILFQLGRVSVVLVLPALALSQSLGLSIYASIAVMGVVSVIYTMLGGIEAVIWTDFLQVVILVGGATTAVVISVLSLDGGAAEFFEVANANNKLALYNPGWSMTQATAWVIFVGYGLGQFSLFVSDQTLVQRCLTTPDLKTAGRAIWLSVLIYLPISVLFYGVGTAMYVFYAAHPEMKPTAGSPDAWVPLFLLQQLPVGLGGLVLAGLFAAGMSTVDSSVNSVATAFVTDVYKPVTGGGPNEATRLWLARAATLLVGLIGSGGAMAVAHTLVTGEGATSLLDAFLGWYSIMAGLMAGLFCLGIFTVRAHSVGALVGLVGGVGMMAGVVSQTEVSFFLWAPIGLIGSWGLGYLASLVIPGRRQDLVGLTLYTQQR